LAITTSARSSTAVTVAFFACFLALAFFFLSPDVLKSRPEKAVWYALHIAGGSVALLIGALQFIAPLRNRFRAYHRQAGYAYVIASVISVGGLYALMPLRYTVFLPSQLVVSGLWLLSVALAIRAIRAGNVLAHQHNMARGYLFAAYFVTVRIVDRYLMDLLVPLVGSEDARLAHSDWLAWVLPLIVLELYFGHKTGKALMARRRGVADAA
jgi:uncharacterized membrane protein